MQQKMLLKYHCALPNEALDMVLPMLSSRTSMNSIMLDTFQVYCLKNIKTFAANLTCKKH